MTDSSLLPFDATTADCIRRELQALIALSKMSSHDDAAVEACMRGLGAILQKQPFCVTDDTANEVLAVATEWNGQQWHEYVAALNAALGRTQQANSDMPVDDLEETYHARMDAQAKSDMTDAASDLLALAATGFGYDLSDADRENLANAAMLLDPKSVEPVKCEHGEHEIFRGYKTAHDRIVHGIVR